MWVADTASDHADFLDRLDAFLSTNGPAFGLAYSGVGDGEFTAYNGGPDSVAETFTITATSATNFTVVGSVTGALPDATVGVAYDEAEIKFTLVAGGTAFQAGDEFTISTAPKAVTLRRALGCKVTATQGNTGVNGAQNLVDGKVSDSSRYWRVSIPITLPQVVEFTFYEPETITVYGMQQFTSGSANGPKAWTLEYWDGSSWVVLDTQADVTDWHETEAKTWSIGSPVSAALYRLVITAVNFANALILGSVQMYRSDGIDAAVSQVIWQLAGNDGDSEIFLGAHIIEREDADYHDLELAAFDNYQAGSRFHQQAGFVGKRFLPLWDNAIPYWFICDGRSVRIVAKISTQYEPAVLGLLDPYFSPDQWPYPMCVGAPIALGSLPSWENVGFRWSNSTDRHRAPTHADTGGFTSPFDPEESQLVVRDLNGLYEAVTGTVNDSIGSSPTSVQAIIWPTRCGMSKLDRNIDGSVSIWPAMISLPGPNQPGQLPGMGLVTGQDVTAETQVKKGAINWLLIPNITRTDRDDWLAVALD